MYDWSSIPRSVWASRRFRRPRAAIFWRNTHTDDCPHTQYVCVCVCTPVCTPVCMLSQYNQISHLIMTHCPENKNISLTHYHWYGYINIASLGSEITQLTKEIHTNQISIAKLAGFFDIHVFNPCIFIKMSRDRAFLHSIWEVRPKIKNRIWFKSVPLLSFSIILSKLMCIIYSFTAK